MGWSLVDGHFDRTLRLLSKDAWSWHRSRAGWQASGGGAAAGQPRDVGHHHREYREPLGLLHLPELDPLLPPCKSPDPLSARACLASCFLRCGALESQQVFASSILVEVSSLYL